MSWPGSDRRRPGHDRLPVRVPVTVLQLRGAGAQWRGRTEDLSIGGARLHLSAAPQLGGRLAVTFHVRKRHRLSTAATVRWILVAGKRRAWWVGVAFLQELPASTLEEMRRRNPRPDPVGHK